MKLGHSLPERSLTPIFFSAPRHCLARYRNRQAATVHVSLALHEPASAAPRLTNGGLSHSLHQRVVKRRQDVKRRGSAHG
jgi:hypothetical protein